MPAKRSLATRISTLGMFGLMGMSLGCTTTQGTRPSIWPTRTSEASVAAPSSGLTGWASKTKGQLSTVGTAFNSAYGKAKDAITSPFTATPAAEQPSGATLAATPKSNAINPEVYVMTGQLNESTGDYKKALDSYSKALEIEPKNGAALIATARLYDRLNERDKAISFYQKCLEVSPTASTLAELGNLHAKAGNLNAAREELQKAVALEPKNTSHRTALAGVMLDLGQEDRALEELLNSYTPAMANYQMAYLHFARKNVPGAQHYAGAALQIDPNLTPARELFASIGGAQSLQNLANQGNQWVNQAQATLQQASAVGTNVQGLLGTPVAPVANNVGAGALPMVNHPNATMTSSASAAYSLPLPPATGGSQAATTVR
jgi:tetratricopeptide (TPR) repeat protein